MDIFKLIVFDHRYLQSIAHICLNDRVINVQVRGELLGKYVKFTDGLLNLH